MPQFISEPIILASKSPYRFQIFKQAGVVFEVMTSGVDERLIQQKNISVKQKAEELAAAKALAVSQNNNGLVIGADQTLELDGRLLTKSKTWDQAKETLLDLQGQTHFLHSAVCAARGDSVVWQHVETCIMTMRVLSPEDVDAYLKEVGDDVLGCVGCYQIEKTGAQLFEAVEGDMLAIMGLPLEPLLEFLKGAEA